MTETEFSLDDPNRRLRQMYDDLNQTDDTIESSRLIESFFETFKSISITEKAVAYLYVETFLSQKLTDPHRRKISSEITGFTKNKKAREVLDILSFKTRFLFTEVEKIINHDHNGESEKVRLRSVSVESTTPADELFFDTAIQTLSKRHSDHTLVLSQLNNFRNVFVDKNHN